MKSSWKAVLNVVSWITLIVLSTILLQMCILEYSDAADISSDGSNMISFEGSIELGDSPAMLAALSEIDVRYAKANMLVLYINSHGGDADVTVQIMYMLKYWTQMRDIRLCTITTGNAFSGGALLFLLGEVRLMGPEAVFMMHEAAFYDPTGKKTTIEEAEKEGLVPEWSIKSIKTINTLMYRMIRKTTYPAGYIKLGKFVMADDCLKYGIATGTFNENF